MAIYNAYLEGAERDAAILSMEMDNQYDKLSMLYEMTLMELAQVKKDIELKVFKESGTYDDLEYLISEAEAQVAQDQTNVLSQILQWFANAIQKMITGIKNFFTGAKDIPDDTEAQVELPEKETEMFTKINGILNSVAGMDGKITMDGVLKVVAGALGVGGTLAGLGAVWNKFDQDHKIKARIMKWGAVKAINAACNKSVGALNKIITDVINKIQDTGVGRWICDQILRPIQQRCDNIINICNGAIQTFKANIGKAVDAVKGAVSGNKKDNNPNAPAAPADGNAGGPGSVSSANPDKGNARINVTFVDNTSGTPVTRRAALDISGKIIGAKDGKPVSANLKAIIQNSDQVKAAVEAIKNKNAKAAQTQPANNQTNPAPAPAPAAPAAPATQPAVKESFDIGDFDLGDDYTIEIAEDGVLEITINTVFECPDYYKSTMESIFGMVAEEEANEDPELKELQDFFGEF